MQGFTEEAKALLLANPWPGNVRQLRNAVDRAVVMGRGDQIYPEDLRDPHPFAQRGTVTTTGADLKVRQKQEQSRNIETALEKANGNCAEAANQLGMAPRTLTRRIKELGVRKPPKK